ncbi:MAG: hypothetical protein NT069_07015 [Planctomycetota bacterium]|nr:hypothetical protein [Planctomycetota bacterium]
MRFAISQVESLTIGRCAGISNWEFRLTADSNSISCVRIPLLNKPLPRREWIVKSNRGESGQEKLAIAAKMGPARHARFGLDLDGFAITIEIPQPHRSVKSAGNEPGIVGMVGQTRYSGAVSLHFADFRAAVGIEDRDFAKAGSHSEVLPIASINSRDGRTADIASQFFFPSREIKNDDAPGGKCRNFPTGRVSDDSRAVFQGNHELINTVR